VMLMFTRGAVIGKKKKQKKERKMREIESRTDGQEGTLRPGIIWQIRDAIQWALEI